MSNQLSHQSAKIFVVATPIGNLDDISLRAIQILKKVDLIAAEDTRNTIKLLMLLGIPKKEILSYHDHGETERATSLLDRIEKSGESLALVSDAGTPCIADPGFRLIKEAHHRGIQVHPIPGVSAMTTLVSVSGLPSDRVLFVGFLPTKSVARDQEIKGWTNFEASIVFFESARRLVQTLKDIDAIFPSALVAVGRELTKLYEEVKQLPISSMIQWFDAHPSLKGEVVVMVSQLQAPTAEGLEEDKLQSLRKSWEASMRKGKSLRDVLKESIDSGLSRSELYNELLEIKAKIDQ